MKQKYYPKSYKENTNPYPTESGRKLRKTNQTQNEPELFFNENGDAFYPELNKKKEIQNVFNNETAYDREKELIEAIDNSQDDNEVPEGVKTTERHNEIKERLNKEENEKHKKYDKYNAYEADEKTKIELGEVLK